MALRHFKHLVPGCALAVALSLAAASTTALGVGATAAPLSFASARVSIAGTSNIHAYTASTTSVRVTRVELAEGVAGATLWDAIVEPRAIDAFEIVIPAASLSSPKEGLDKNMHKALKVQEHPDITFRLRRLEAGTAGSLKAVGMLQIAGVEREIALDIKTERRDSTLAVKGEVQLLMTDYGITPPKAMLGMLKTDPKVTVAFETVLAIPLT
jgi:polyisoprenoid-binding protein YceI